VTTVGVVGLGAMGGRIARRLLESGHEVVVWNRTPDKMKVLGGVGALRASSPADAARRADAVLTMVADPAALRAVTEGTDGIGSAGGAVTVIQMSTVGPADISRLASVVPTSMDLLDAPVLGSVSEAESGELTIFLSGAVSVVERWTPLLSALGTPMPVGALGAGTAAKLVANSTLLDVLGVLGEALALAQGLGLAGDAAFDVLAATPIAAQAERRRRSIETATYPLRFSLTLARKDADLIDDAAAAAGVDLRHIRAARSWLADAQASGFGDRDYSSVLAHILRQEPR
jgi:3-hydroxyisobutyrate dehydrogenase-like beta-hydroxyacid dehydrogenase